MTTTADVVITSPTSLPKNQDVVVSWKANNPDIVGFEIRIGTGDGRWDILNCRLGKDLREVRLPGLPETLTPLYMEFGYIVPSSSMMTGHESYANALLSEEPLKFTRV